MLFGGHSRVLGKLLDFFEQCLEIVIELFLLDLDRHGALDRLFDIALGHQLHGVDCVLVVVRVLLLDGLEG